MNNITAKLQDLSLSASASCSLANVTQTPTKVQNPKVYTFPYETKVIRKEIYAQEVSLRQSWKNNIYVYAFQKLQSKLFRLLGTVNYINKEDIYVEVADSNQPPISGTASQIAKLYLQCMIDSQRDNPSLRLDEMFFVIPIYNKVFFSDKAVCKEIETEVNLLHSEFSSKSL